VEQVDQDITMGDTAGIPDSLKDLAVYEGQRDSLHSFANDLIQLRSGIDKQQEYLRSAADIRTLVRDVEAAIEAEEWQIRKLRAEHWPPVDPDAATKQRAVDIDQAQQLTNALKGLRDYRSRSAPRNTLPLLRCNI
jgi:hypothetical protein